MAFADKYITADMMLVESSSMIASSPDSPALEVPEKILISNDAFAIGEMLELLSNTMRGK